MYRNRRTYVTCLAAAVLALTCLAVLMVPDTTLTGGRVAAQTPTATPSPTPWQTDPLGSPGNYTLFRNDNLFIAGEVAYPPGTYPNNNTCGNNATLGYNNTSYNYTTQSSSPAPLFTDAVSVPQQAGGRQENSRITGGSGRILNANKEQGVIYKLSDFQGSAVGQATYSVELFDKTGGLYTHKFPAVQAGGLSFLDVAVGDLDRLRDANDQYQDEVVLVSESGGRTVQLTVMSFLNAADASWTDCAQEGATCSFDGSRVVRYGANGNYVYGTFNGSVECSNDALGSDPSPGDGKACAYAATWTDCADQYGTCTFDGERRVRYGANGNYNYGTFTGSIECVNGNFGDPAPGDPTKTCAYDSAWTNCAQEGGTCTFDGSRRVRYGVDGAYFYGTFNGSVSCSNDAFGGDPAFGTPKTCDIQAPLTPLITTFTTNLGVSYYPDDPVNDPDTINKGGQISAAVGDFDGDGKMEIAVVNIAGTSLEMTIFRYTNDGKGNAGFVVQDSRPIANPVNRYVDIAAGDFTGAGHDQIIVGYVSGVPANDPQIHVDAWDVTNDTNGVIKASGEINGVAFGSARNGISKNCDNGCNDFITQPGWVQIKAGLYKYDPNNGYNTRRRQLGIVWGNSRPVAGIMEIAPNTTPALSWLPGASPFNLDQKSDSSFWVSRGGESEGEVPDTREAYTIVAGNFGGLNPQNPASQLGILAPYLNKAPISPGCSGSSYTFYYTQPALTLYQYTQGSGTSDDPYTFSLENYNGVPSQPFGWQWTKRTIGGRNLAAVALDLDGNSLHLGAPARIVVDNLLTTDAVLQEPPKHLDWVCGSDDFLNPAKCAFVNVSRYKSFNLTYTDASGTTTSNKVTSTADTAVGKSSTKSAEESLEVGRPLAKVELDFEQKWESESDSKNSQENYSKSVSGRSFSYETETNQADQIYSRTRTMVVYRYPLYGKPDPANPGQQKFYDLTLPVETDVISSPGDTSEWYQPIHENGNLLTYPWTKNFDPGQDYGFYTAYGQAATCSVSTSRPCRSNSDCPSGETCSGVASSGLLADPVTNTFGSNSTSTGITYKQAGTTGANISTSQTLKSSEELKFGFKATWSLPIEAVDVGGTVGGSLQYNTDNESSWSNATVSESTTSSSKGIDLKLPSISTPNTYLYKTWAYITGGGFLKVAHAADITTTGGAAAWYAQTYGKYPDLSLNLPRKFLQDESDSNKDGVFTLNTAIERKETKSIFLTDPDVKNLDGSPSYIAGAVDVNPAVPAGTNLLVNIRVYNLSTNVAIAGNDPNLFASIELATYDPATAAEGPRIPVGNAPIPAIPAYGGDCAPLNGDGSVNPNYPVCNSVVITGSVNGSELTALGPGTYRLYVVLDPANALPNEYHEWQDRRNDPLLQVAGDPNPGTPVDDNVNPYNNNQPSILEKGQNNEGWIYLNVVAQTLDTVSNRTPELSMAQNSLAADVFTGEPSAVRPRANIHTPVRIRARVDSDGDNLGHQHVMFFDQDPDQGGKPFAIRLLRGVTKGANYAWVNYTPRQLGRQTIWARVVEHAADKKPGNHTTSVVLIVRPADTQPPRLFVTVTPLVLTPPDDRMVEVAATVLTEDNQDRAPRVRLEAITYNDGNDASADVSGAVFGTDDRQFALRAKRSARGEGPVIYEVVYSATDRSGNKTYAKAYVTVPRRR